MKKKNSSKVIILIFIVSVVLLVIKYINSSFKFGHNGLGVDEFRNLLLSYGKWAIVILFLIYIIKPLFVVTPISLVAIVTGIIYGPIFGTIYAMVGAFFSATVGFYIARFLGQDFVDKLLKGKNTKIEGDIEKKGFTIMLFLRLAFVFPYDPLSYAAGLSKMRYRDFIMGTVIGVLPEMCAYNYLGTNADNLLSKKTLGAILIIAALALSSVLIKSKKNKKLM